MPHAITAYFTDFADQAVILPLILCVAVLLWVSGWRRGAVVWCLGTAATLGATLLLKLTFSACGPEIFHGSIESPSGHTATAGAVYGSIFAFLYTRLGGQQVSRILVVLAVVVIVGSSRMLLGAHNLPEVCLGGFIGFAAAQMMLHLAGEPTGRRSVTLTCLPLLALPLLLHGMHLQAESEIGELASKTWPFSLCR